MIGRLEEALADPSKARAALDGPAELAGMAGIAAAGGARSDAGGLGAGRRGMPPLRKARDAGLLWTMRENPRKLGPRSADRTRRARDAPRHHLGTA